MTDGDDDPHLQHESGGSNVNRDTATTDTSGTNAASGDLEDHVDVIWGASLLGQSLSAFWDNFICDDGITKGLTAGCSAHIQYIHTTAL